MSETPPSPGNPYAPPGVETRTRDQGPGSGLKSLRIVGGVVAILFGLWGLMGGGCTVVAGVAMRPITSELAKELEQNDAALKAMRDMERRWPGLIVSGVVAVVSGLLANVVGVLFFFNRGRLLALITVALTVGGEGLLMVLFAFNMSGVIKIAAFAFVGACALWGLGREDDQRPALTP